MPTNTYIALATQTLSSSASTITFSSINQGYTDLVLVFQATAASANMNFDIRVGNGTVDSGSNYSDTYLLGGSGGAQSARASNQDRLRVGNSAFIQSSGGVFTATTHFMNYSNTTTYKTTLSRDGNVNQSVVESSVGLWRSTAAINIITLGDFGGATMAAGTTVSLYGIAATSVGAKATGGIISSDDLYYYHTFPASGTFTPLQSLTADYLVVAGGGGGANFISGGGGAGGLRSTVGATGGGGSLESALTLLTATNYTVTIGAGGAGATGPTQTNIYGSNGNNSIFSTVTSTGGGGGAANTGTLNGNSGGSGGGGCGYYASAGGAGTANQGFAGGGTPLLTYGQNGGGGAGAVGVSTSAANVNGAGGAGVTTSISGSSITYAGGGGGGGLLNAGSNATGGAGGAGGGGAGGTGASSPTAGTDGTTNRGGGGGGGGSNGNTGVGAAGGAGGSGIVIIRYPKA